MIHPHPLQHYAPVHVAAAPVFLAEDNDHFRETLTIFMRRLGYPVVAMADGRALVEQLGRRWRFSSMAQPAAVVCDVFLPKITGLNVLRGVAGHPDCPPFIMMSAFADPDTIDAVIRLGARTFLDKPFPLGLLARALESVAPPPAAPRPAA